MDLDALQSTLADVGGRWQAGETRLAQLSLLERRYRLGYEPGPREASLPQRTLLAAQRMAAASPSTALPQWDWRDVQGIDWMTPVKDQGACGSCVAFGSIAALEAQVRISQASPDLMISLSEAHLWFCWGPSHGAGTCPAGGWSVDSAYDGMMQGVVDSSCFAYTPIDQACSLCAGWPSRLRGITSWYPISDVDEMKQYLASTGPLTTGFTVYDDFYQYVGGVYHPVSDVEVGGHCVCVVGYDDSGGCWICKNSWGPDAQEDGYFRIQYGVCGIDAEMWAIESIAAPTA
jgi:C1A family cysteine protease